MRSPRKREFERAIADFDQAIKLGPGNAVAFNERGNAHAALGQCRPARSPTLTRPSGSIANYDVAYNNRGTAWRAKGDLNRAMADFDAAVRVNPSFALAFHNRASAHHDRSDFDRAIADLSQTDQA